MRFVINSPIEIWASVYLERVALFFFQGHSSAKDKRSGKGCIWLSSAISHFRYGYVINNSLTFIQFEDWETLIPQTQNPWSSLQKRRQIVKTRVEKSLSFEVTLHKKQNPTKKFSKKLDTVTDDENNRVAFWYFNKSKELWVLIEIIFQQNRRKRREKACYATNLRAHPL